MVEIWEDIIYKGELTEYLVSTDGRIKHKPTNTILKPFYNKGYAIIVLVIKNKHKMFKVHRLVANAFFGKPENKNMEVNHINGIKQDNRIENLEWVSPRDNCIHAVISGLKPDVKINVETAHKICRLLATRKYTNKEIAKMCNCTKGIVNDIRIRHSWVFISSLYDLPEPRKFKVNWSKYYDDIDYLLIKGFSNKEIMKLIPIEGSNKKSYTSIISMRKKILREIEKVEILFNDYSERK